MKNEIAKKELLVLVLGASLLIGATFFADGVTLSENQTTLVVEAIVPEDGINIPVNLSLYSKELIDLGVIDAERLEKIYESRGGLSEDELDLLYGRSNSSLVITEENSGLVLNILWAFGLSNKNPVLEEGPMMKYDGDASGFASTGGWTLARGDSMDHYSKYEMVVLSEEEQFRVEEISKNIYRPCCGNSTYFPDCNHGMAMLGLIELLVEQGLSDEEIYEIALGVNSYWFPGTYETIAEYFALEGISWGDVDPKLALSDEYSSSSGFRKVLSKVKPSENSGGGACSV